MSNTRAPSPIPAAEALEAQRGRGPSAVDVGDDARTVPSEALFRGAAELRIDHGGVIYRLKQTALGKLILTK